MALSPITATTLRSSSPLYLAAMAIPNAAEIGSGGMSYTECVIFTFASFGEAADAFILSVRKNCPGVRLIFCGRMPGGPHPKPVDHRECGTRSGGRLQVRLHPDWHRNSSAMNTHHINDKLTEFITYLV